MSDYRPFGGAGSSYRATDAGSSYRRMPGGTPQSSYRTVPVSRGPKKKKHGGGFLSDVGHGFGVAGGLVKNLGSEIGHQAAGIGPGLYHAGKAVYHDLNDPAQLDPRSIGRSETYKKVLTPLGKSYAQTYGPLRHGHVGQFLHQLYEHPLGPLLDVAALATGGAGAVARAGKVAAEAGAISKTSRLARLGEPAGRELVLRNEPALLKAGARRRDLTLRRMEPHVEPAAQLAQTRKVPVSANPARRAQQHTLAAILKQFPAHTPVVGEVARYQRELDRAVQHGPRQFMQRVNAYRHAYSHLRPFQQVALHFRATAVDPLDYANHLERLHAGAMTPPVEKTLTLLRSPELAKALHTPSKQFERAVALGRIVADDLKQSHLALARAQGATPEQLAALERSFEERPYLHRRLLSGAEYVTKQNARKLLRQIDTGIKGLEGEASRLSGQAARASEQRARLAGALPEATRARAALQQEAEHHLRQTDGLLAEAWQLRNDGELSDGEYQALHDEAAALQRRAENLLPSALKQQRHEQATNLAAQRGAEIAARQGMIGGHLETARALRADVAARAGTFVGGHSITRLREQIAAEGREQPFYMPDMPAARRLRDPFIRRGGGVGVPRAEDALKANRGILFNTARLALHPETLDRRFVEHTRHVLHDAVHHALEQNAIRLPKGAPLPEGYLYIRRSKYERIPATEQMAGAVEERLRQLVPERPAKGESAGYSQLVTSNADEARGAGGHRLVVSERFARGLAGEFTRSSSTLAAFVNKPVAVWRALVLGLRPGFFTNNVVGNNLLYAVRFAGRHGIEGYTRMVADTKGADFVKRMLRAETKRNPQLLERPDLQKVYEEYAPELLQGTFGRTQFEGLGKTFAKGIGPFTAKVAEDLPRKAGFIAHITPAVRAAMKEDGLRFLDRLTADNKTFAAYARKALDRDPQLARRAIDDVNNGLGDYLSMSAFERNTVRNLIPFYGWLKAITRITLKTAVDTPGRADAMAKIGQIGQEDVQQALGEVPSWLEPFVPLGPERGGYVHGINTAGLNPYATDAQIAQAVGQLLAGKPGGYGELGSQLNPLLQGAIQQFSGRSLVTGAPVRGIPAGIVGNIGYGIAQGLPQWRLIQALAGRQYQGSPGHPTLYRRDLRTELLRFLGAPVADLNVAKAHQYAQGPTRR